MKWQTIPFEALYMEPSKNGLNRPTKVRGSGFKMVNMGELFAFDRIDNQEMERVPMNERELQTYLLQEGDLLFARQSLVLSGAGRCSIVMNTTEPTTFEGHLIRVRLAKQLCDPMFYYYYFGSSRSPIRAIVQQCAQAGIKASDLAKLRVVSPPRETQARIADILSAYDTHIENNRRRIQLLEQSARMLYKEWFVRLRFPGHEHVKIINGVPEGWEKCPLSRLVEEIRDSVDPNNVSEDKPYIGLEHIPRRSITLSEWGKAADITSQKFAFKKGDILFGKIRPYFHKVGFSLSDGITSIDTVVLRPVNSLVNGYSLLLVSSDFFVALASKTVREGSKMPRADWKYLSSCLFLSPPDPLLEVFESTVNPIVIQLRNLAMTNHKLASARDILLRRLMNGEIEV